ncbi:hypothetical protein I5168_07740 [Nonlabens sp. SCSIO 43208]|uniref:hypothetical protein n=2 Tax=unclassified Nonlabens TaxID=2615035 RepID=UPI001428CE5D
MSVMINHKVNLVEGTFTPQESLDIINALIKEKINFHKLHRLSIAEGNLYEDTSYDDDRVAQLNEERQSYREFYKEIKQSGKKLRIKGTIEIEVLD